jgi:probable phosphoglycerate mutase
VRPRLAEGDVALVAHAHSLRILTARWLGLDAAAARLFRLETASFGVLGFEHQRPVVRRWSVRD